MPIQRYFYTPKKDETVYEADLGDANLNERKMVVPVLGKVYLKKGMRYEIVEFARSWGHRIPNKIEVRLVDEISPTIKLQWEYTYPDSNDVSYRDLDVDEDAEHFAPYYVLVYVDGQLTTLPEVLLAGEKHPAFSLAKKYVENALKEGWDFYDPQDKWEWDQEKGEMKLNAE